MKDENWIQSVIERVHDKGDVARNGRDPERDHSLHTKSGEDQKRSEIASGFNPSIGTAQESTCADAFRASLMFGQTACRLLAPEETLRNKDHRHRPRSAAGQKDAGASARVARSAKIIATAAKSLAIEVRNRWNCARVRTRPLTVGLVWKRNRSTTPCLAIEHTRFGRTWSVHTCGGNQHCEHVDVKLFLQARSEPPEPFVLSQVGQLLSCHRAFKL